MSTYSEESFNSKFYQENRPSYPETLFNAIMTYHKGGKAKAVDVGCGTGIATFPLLQYFNEVDGLDPSATMLACAEILKKSFTADDQHRVAFKCCAAENLTDVLDRNSTDMVIGAECVHWMNHSKFFEQAHAILKPGGTLAFFFYVEPIFLDYPEANQIYEKYVYEDPRYMGPMWKPGKEYLRNFGESIEIPEKMFTDIERHVYRPLVSKQKTEYYEYRDSLTVSDFRKYLRSWSAYHSWQQQYGDTGMDVAEMMIAELKVCCGWDETTTKLRVEWGTAYYMARKINH